MNKILVTGATGALGSATLQALLQRRDATDLIAMVRDPEKAVWLEAQGVEVRRGDYFDTSSLSSAFEGVETVMMVSAVAFTDRLAQHLNVIQTAKQAGVRRLVYTSIQRKHSSGHVISMVTEDDIATEQALADSGLEYTVLRNCLYQEALPYMLGPDWINGLQTTVGDGRAPIVSRSDLALANAIILTQPGHEDKTYTLGASESVSFRDMAVTLEQVIGREIPYQVVPKLAITQRLTATGFPAAAADFLHDWIEAVNVGEFEEVTGDLERLIGRRPISCLEFIAAHYRDVEWAR